MRIRAINLSLKESNILAVGEISSMEAFPVNQVDKDDNVHGSMVQHFKVGEPYFRLWYVIYLKEDIGKISKDKVLKVEYETHIPMEKVKKYLNDRGISHEAAINCFKSDQYVEYSRKVKDLIAEALKRKKLVIPGLEEFETDYNELLKSLRR